MVLTGRSNPRADRACPRADQVGIPIPTAQIPMPTASIPVPIGSPLVVDASTLHWARFPARHAGVSQSSMRSPPEAHPGLHPALRPPQGSRRGCPARPVPRVRSHLVPGSSRTPPSERPQPSDLRYGGQKACTIASAGVFGAASILLRTFSLEIGWPLCLSL